MAERSSISPQTCRSWSAPATWSRPTVLVLVAEVADGEEFPDGGHPIGPGYDNLEVTAEAGSTHQARGTGLDGHVAVTKVKA